MSEPKNTVYKIDDVLSGSTYWIIKCWSGGYYRYMNQPTEKEIESPYMGGDCLPDITAQYLLTKRSYITITKT
jgi:hypothetical protein